MAEARHDLENSPYVPVQPFDDWLSAQIDIETLNLSCAILMQKLSASDRSAAVELRRRLLREAAITTGAVEELYELATGQTRTIAVGGDGSEGLIATQGISKLNAFADQLAAYEYASDLATSQAEVSTLMIREIHSIACRSQETYQAYAEHPQTGAPVPHQVTLQRGEYKKNPNHVRRRDGSVLEYCPPIDTSKEMLRFVDEMRGDSFRQAHPITRASYSHYGLVHIHPFADGNGRVARILSSLFLMPTYLVPLIVYPDRRMTYFQALDFARTGELKRMTDYVSDRVLETLGRALQELEDITEESLADELTQLRSAIASAPEISIEAASELAATLLREFAGELDKALTKSVTDVGGGALKAQVSINEYSPSGIPSGGYTAQKSGFVSVELTRPAKLAVRRTVIVAIAEDLGARFTFRLFSQNVQYGLSIGQAENTVDVRFEDVSPTLSEGARPRVILAANALAKQMLRELNRDLAATLRQSGHSGMSI